MKQNRSRGGDTARILTEMVSPTLLAPDYPLSFANANPVKWEEIPDSDKTGNVSYKHANYNYFGGNETTRSRTFIEQMST